MMLVTVLKYHLEEKSKKKQDVKRLAEVVNKMAGIYNRAKEQQIEHSQAGEFAARNKNKTILVVASVERQALLLFEKILSFLYDNHKKLIKKGKHKPTKHKLQLTNG